MEIAITQWEGYFSTIATAGQAAILILAIGYGFL